MNWGWHCPLGCGSCVWLSRPTLGWAACRAPPPPLRRGELHHLHYLQESPGETPRHPRPLVATPRLEQGSASSAPTPPPWAERPERAPLPEGEGLTNSTSSPLTFMGSGTRAWPQTHPRTLPIVGQGLRRGARQGGHIARSHPPPTTGTEAFAEESPPPALFLVIHLCMVALMADHSFDLCACFAVRLDTGCTVICYYFNFPVSLTNTAGSAVTLGG
jgi:hypothetical protein